MKLQAGRLRFKLDIRIDYCSKILTGGASSTGGFSVRFSPSFILSI